MGLITQLWQTVLNISFTISNEKENEYYVK